MPIRTHKYDIMTEDMRPQDEGMDGSNLTFETLEHGGEFPDMMPQAIKVIDSEGRWCVYTPVSVYGKVVRSRGFTLVP